MLRECHQKSISPIQSQIMVNILTYIILRHNVRRLIPKQTPHRIFTYLLVDKVDVNNRRLFPTEIKG